MSNTTLVHVLLSFLLTTDEEKTNHEQLATWSTFLGHLDDEAVYELLEVVGKALDESTVTLVTDRLRRLHKLFEEEVSLREEAVLGDPDDYSVD